MIICRSILLRIKNVPDENSRDNQNTHFMFNNFFSENHAVYEIMWKNIVETDRPQLTICVHAHCILYTNGYKRPFRIWNTYCFSTVTVVARTRLSITLYILYLTCSNFMLGYSVYCFEIRQYDVSRTHGSLEQFLQKGRNFQHH